MLPSKQLLCIKERQLYYCQKKVAANTEAKMLCKFFPNNSILDTEGMIFAKSLLPIEEQSHHYSRFLVASSLTKSLAATPYPNGLFYLQFGKSDLQFYYLTLPYTNSELPWKNPSTQVLIKRHTHKICTNSGPQFPPHVRPRNYAFTLQNIYK